MNILHNTRSFIGKHKTLIILSFFLTFLLLILPACNDNQSGDLIGTSGGSDNVSVGFFSEQSTGDNTLVITEAKFLIRKMTFKREEGENECDVKVGPFVVQLDLTPKVVIAAINRIPVGNYDKVKFQIHKPSPNETISDPDFTESTSKRFSVVAKGFYNGVPFVYKSAITVERKIEFENHSVLIDAAPLVNVTLRVNPYSWFLQNGALLDPGNEQNQHEIDKNIKESLKRAFRDLNCDGEPD